MRSIARIGLFCATATVLATTCTLAMSAATVNVSYVAPEKFVDFGYAPSELKSNREALTRHFVKLGERRLRDGQTLDIEVLDVDLAGSARPWRTIAGSEVRVVRDSDWTRVHVRYTLHGGGMPSRSGDEWISGIGQSLDPLWRSGSDTLGTERRMLDEWYAKRFGKDSTAP